MTLCSLNEMEAGESGRYFSNNSVNIGLTLICIYILQHNLIPIYPPIKTSIYLNLHQINK